MRISRSISFDSAVKIMESVKQQEADAAKEAKELWDKSKTRLYIIPYSYNGDKGRRKGFVRVEVMSPRDLTMTTRKGVMRRDCVQARLA